MAVTSIQSLKQQPVAVYQSYTPREESIFYWRVLLLGEYYCERLFDNQRNSRKMEELRKVNADIITSINEVVKIHEEGSKRRAETTEELGKIENE